MRATGSLKKTLNSVNKLAKFASLRIRLQDPFDSKIFKRCNWPGSLGSLEEDQTHTANWIKGDFMRILAGRLMAN